MKFGEFLQKTFGFDLNKEMDMQTIAQNVQDFPNAMNPPEPPANQIQQQEQSSTVEHSNTVVYQQPTTIIQDDPAERIRQQQAEIERLKNLNSALLNKTPVEDKPLKTEDMIYRAVIGVER